MQRSYTLHPYRGGPRAFHPRTHLVQQQRQILHLGLARGVLNYGLAFGQNSGHQHILGSGDGDAVEMYLRARQTARRSRFHVAVRILDFGAQLFERGDVQIDRTSADRAASRHRNPRAAGSSHQWPQD
jgi:hypothetical protein